MGKVLDLLQLARFWLCRPILSLSVVAKSDDSQGEHVAGAKSLAIVLE